MSRVDDVIELAIIHAAKHEPIRNGRCMSTDRQIGTRTRHISVLRLTHNRGYFAGKRTLGRIFKSVLKWSCSPSVNRCQSCKMHARTLCLDRVPSQVIPMDSLQSFVIYRSGPNERLITWCALLLGYPCVDISVADRNNKKCSSRVNKSVRDSWYCERHCCNQR